MSPDDAYPLLLRVPEVAKRLRLSERTVQRMIARGELPAIQIGGRNHAVRVDKAELEARLAESRSRTAGGRMARTAPPSPLLLRQV